MIFLDLSMCLCMYLFIYLCMYVCIYVNVVNCSNWLANVKPTLCSWDITYPVMVCCPFYTRWVSISSYLLKICVTMFVKPVGLGTHVGSELMEWKRAASLYRHRTPQLSPSPIRPFQRGHDSGRGWLRPITLHLPGHWLVATSLSSDFRVSFAHGDRSSLQRWPPRGWSRWEELGHCMSLKAQRLSPWVRGRPGISGGGSCENTWRWGRADRWLCPRALFPHVAGRPL